MAPKSKKKLFKKRTVPNLKICVDNTEELSSSISASSEEEGEISEDDVSIVVEASSMQNILPIADKRSEPSINRKIASPVHSDEESTLTADIENLETFGVVKVSTATLKYIWKL